MGMEIERKWLVKALPGELSQYAKKELEQAYLNFAPAIRVRHNVSAEQEKYELTYKGSGLVARREENLPLDAESYRNLLAKHDGSIIRKTRYLIPLPGEGRYTAELDVFHAELEGLRLVEVEFPSLAEAESFTAPDWFGEDVSGTGQYSNSNLAKNGGQNFLARPALR